MWISVYSNRCGALGNAMRKNTPILLVVFVTSCAESHRIASSPARTPVSYAQFIQTIDGTAVRSKSEVIVYEVLTRLGLSVEYEKPLIARGGDEKDFVLPDFTIRRRGKIWYWEHLGMLDKEAYRTNWENKRKWYEQNGYAEQLVTSQDHAGGLGGRIFADEIRKTAEETILK